MRGQAPNWEPRVLRISLKGLTFLIWFVSSYVTPKLVPPYGIPPSDTAGLRVFIWELGGSPQKSKSKEKNQQQTFPASLTNQVHLLSILSSTPKPPLLSATRIDCVHTLHRLWNCTAKLPRTRAPWPPSLVAAQFCSGKRCFPFLLFPNCSVTFSLISENDQPPKLQSDPPVPCQQCCPLSSDEQE